MLPLQQRVYDDVVASLKKRRADPTTKLDFANAFTELRKVSDRPL